MTSPPEEPTPGPDADLVDADLFNADWDKPRRTNKLTVVLVAGLIATLAFTGGVFVQKRHDAGLVSAASNQVRARFPGAGAGGADTAGGTEQGGAPGAGQSGRTGGQGGARQGGQDNQGGPQGGAAAPPAEGAPADAVPVAVGTVTSISGNTLTITNFAGKVITVTVPPTATVTTSGLGALAVGMPVSVSGTTGPDGTVTATSLISRKVSG